MITLYAYLLVGLAMGMIIAIRRKDLSVLEKVEGPVNNSVDGFFKGVLIGLFVLTWSIFWLPVMFWVLLLNKDFK